MWVPFHRICDYCSMGFFGGSSIKILHVKFNSLSQIELLFYCHVSGCARSFCCCSYITSPTCYKKLLKFSFQWCFISACCLILVKQISETTQIILCSFCIWTLTSQDFQICFSWWCVAHSSYCNPFQCNFSRSCFSLLSLWYDWSTHTPLYQERNVKCLTHKSTSARVKTYKLFKFRK
jgi:hypothetical protein